MTEPQKRNLIEHQAHNHSEHQRSPALLGGGRHLRLSCALLEKDHLRFRSSNVWSGAELRPQRHPDQTAVEKLKRLTQTSGADFSPEPRISVALSNQTTRERQREEKETAWGRRGARARAERPLCQRIKRGAWRGGARGLSGNPWKRPRYLRKGANPP